MFQNIIMACVLAASSAPVDETAPRIEQQASAKRVVFDLQLALNLNAAASLRYAGVVEVGLSVQIFGLAHLIAPSRGFPASAALSVGPSWTLLNTARSQLDLVIAPHVAALFFSGGWTLYAGASAKVRWVHRSGLVLSASVPLVGWGASPLTPRGGLQTYYLGALVFLPLLAAGYSF